MKTGLLAVAILVLWPILSELSAQQTSKASSDASVRQNLQAQSKAISNLTERIAALEARIPSESTESSKKTKIILTSVKSELAMFDNGCKSEQDPAAAMAVAENAPVLTYMGGAAMNCTERLKKITDHLVETLEAQ